MQVTWAFVIITKWYMRRAWTSASALAIVYTGVACGSPPEAERGDGLRRAASDAVEPVHDHAVGHERQPTRLPAVLTPGLPHERNAREDCSRKVGATHGHG